MTGKEKIIHRVTVNSAQPMVLPRRGNFALRRSRLIRRRIRQGFYTAGFILSMAAISHAGYDFFMEAPFFSVKPVRVEGVSEPLRKELEGLVKSFAKDKQNLLTIDADELSKHVSQHPRVRDIRVEKVYPDQLLVTAVERDEVAIATTENGFFLLDNEGHVMDSLDIEDQALLKYPYISGLRTEEVHEGEPVKSTSLANALNLLQVLEARNPSLYDKVSQIEIRGDDVSPLEILVAHMKNGLEVKFGDSNPVEKLPALETLLQKLSSENIDPFNDLVYIDLRFDDMAFYMDKETAWDIQRNNYDELQRIMARKNEEYRRKNPEAPYRGPGETGKRESASSGKSVAGNSAGSSSRGRAAAAPGNRTRTRTSSPNYAAYQNYQQPAQQYYQPQYNQQQRQYQYPQARQSAPMYNLPANQQRY